MEKKVFKRGGRPNRGGGRHNRGGRGRGRGFTKPEPPKPKLGGSSGTAGRKSGANLYDDDDIYDAYEDDGESYDMFQGTSHQVPRKEPETRKDFFRGASSRGFRGRGGQVKVMMQHLHMTSENQELVKGMLKDLHGSEEITSEDEYEELDYRAENQYWIVDNKMKIEDSAAHGAVRHSTGPRSGDACSVSPLAVKKLMRQLTGSQCDWGVI